MTGKGLAQMNLKILATAAALAMSAVGAHAATITFEGPTWGPDFTGPVTENGFNYSTGSGHLYLNTFGNPGQDMEGQMFGDGGVLTIVKDSPGLFTFDSLDFGAYDAFHTFGQTLTVNGYLGGNIIETNTFSLNGANASGGTLSNWTHETNILPTQIDRLDIVLNAKAVDGNVDQQRQFYAAVDNVNLTGVPGSGTPEPATWAMMVIGFGGLGAMIRSRRRHALA
jgi:hypothetical protein